MATVAFFSGVPFGAKFTIVTEGTAESSLYGMPGLDFIERIAGYKIMRPIPVTYEEASDTDIQAAFAPANIAISGTSKQDAYQALIEELLTAFDDWSADESALGPGPRQQLAVLRTYIGGKTTP